MLEQKSITKIALIYIFAIILTAMNLTNIRVAGINNLWPLFDLMAIFYFGIFKNHFGLTFIFFLGIWNDAINGNPLGLTSLSYIVLIKIFSIINGRILSGENFIQIWKQFVIFLILFLTFKLILFVVISGNFISIKIMLLQYLISIFIYVPMHAFFDYLSKKLLEE